jgi:hypothetical protein
MQCMLDEQFYIPVRHGRPDESAVTIMRGEVAFYIFRREPSRMTHQRQAGDLG